MNTPRPDLSAGRRNSTSATAGRTRAPSILAALRLRMRRALARQGGAEASQHATSSADETTMHAPCL